MSDVLKLPETWASPLLREVCDVRSGFGFPRQLQGKHEGDYPFFKVGDISEAWQRGEVFLSNGDHFLNKDEAKEIGATPIPAGATVFAKIGAAIALNRRAILRQPSLIDNNCMGVISRAPVMDERYVFYFLCTQRFGGVSRASIVPSLRKSDVEDIFIPLPPEPEQRRIVQKIEELFSKLDAGVAALGRVKANLKRYRAAVLKAAVEGKLTAEWRAQHPNTEPASKLLDRILKERRRKWEEAQLAKYTAAGKQPPKGWNEKYKEPARPDISDLPASPATWAIASLDQVTTTITSGSRDWSQYYDRGSGTFIMAQNVRPGQLDLSVRQAVDPPLDDRDRARSQVSVGDVLVTIVGANTGDVCRIVGPLPDHYVCQSVALMRPVDPGQSPFLEAYLVSLDNGQRQFRRIIYGQGRPHLGFDELRVTPVLLPALAEQAEIVAEVERRLSIVDELEAQVAADLKRAGRLRQSILKRAFAGRLVPQDPNDEPAAKLLERVRLDRSRMTLCRPSKRRKEPANE